jgi:hypothetical protein
MSLVVAALAADWGPLHGYSWVLGGGLVLAGWFVHWWRRTPAAPVALPRPPVWPWFLLLAVAVAVGLSGAVATPGLRRDGFAGATWGGGAAGLVALLLALAWHARRRAARTD